MILGSIRIPGLPAGPHLRSRLTAHLAAPLSTLLFAALVVLLTVPAGAQTTRHPRRETTATRKARIERNIEQTYGHPWEAAGGGGYLRFRSGPFLQQNNEVTFWASTMHLLSPTLGVIGEVHGAFGNAKIGNTPYDLGNPQISEYTFTAGPNYRFLRKERYGASVFAEGGLGLGKFAGASKGFTAQDIGVWTGDFGAAIVAGVNLDYNFDTSLSMRITPEYTGTSFGSSFQNSKGFNIGLLYRFGHRH